LASQQKNLAVVTGGAGGMGAAIAKRFSAEGWPMLLCDLHADRLEATAAPLRAAGPVEILAGDITDLGFPAQLVAATKGRGIGAFIHTAGLSPTMADGPRILEVNYGTTLRLVDAVRSHMAENSCAVLISSMSAHMIPSPEMLSKIASLTSADGVEPLRPFATVSQSAYPVSKRAVIALVAREAKAFGARKSRIVSISPGLIDTGMGRAEAAASAMVEKMLAMTPAGREGTADEIASVAAFLCSSDASYITGSDIRVDGGTLAAMGM
jgi:NAD(P)-dependent dehydrogenase (short-subunit alcohol dehydrogenase family)